MTDVFSQILNMSLTGSIVIGVVVLARICIRKLPKIFSYALWSVVLFRLLCPVSISGPGSLLELLKPQVEETADAVSVVSYLPVPEDLPEFQYVSAEAPEAQSTYAEERLSPMDVFGWVWITGVCAMGLYAVAQFLLLHKRLVGAVRQRGNVFLADHIDTAFVMGLVFPRIYLPSHVPISERKYILAHERHHIRRGDHVIKLLAYFALCIHWFNPLVWMAFLLAGKDMEMSCDEAVIRRFGSGIRAEYSASLLRLAAHRKPVPGMPLAFGEGDTKGRILNMAKWKKPRLWVSILCGILCIAILAACAVNPEKETTTPQTTDDLPEETYMESAPAESGNSTNILMVILPDGEESAKLGDSTLVLTLNESDNALRLQSIPGEQVVSLPDYQNHTTGSEPFRTCYALGYVWGGRAAAMEMTNACLQESFGIHVDYNVELTWSELKNLIDSFGGVRVPLEPSEMAGLASLDIPALRNAQPGNHLMDGETATAYASPQSFEEDSASAEARRLRQRKLLAAVFSTVRENPRYAAQLPVLYSSNDLNDTSGEWSAILEYLDAHTTFYLVGAESGSHTQQPDAAGVDIVTDTQLVQYGSLKLLLPEGYSSYAKDNEVILTKDGIDVGGIRCYTTPDIPYDISVEYLASLGVPEALLVLQQEDPIAYMIEGNIGSEIVAEFFHELKPETLNTEHHFYADLDDTLIYDVYYDVNLINDVQADKFLRSVTLGDEPVYPEQPEKADALLLCRNVLNSIQSGPYQVAANRENEGDYALNRYSDTVYAALNEDWVSITHVPDDDSYHGYMYARGKHYSNEGSAWDENGNVNWKEDPYPDEVYVPWIVSFHWDAELVTYIDTILESGRKTVMLRIDEPMHGYEDLTTCYFVNVHFTEDGSFLNAEIMIDFIWENDVASVEITESIVTLDEAAVSNYIENEYNRAVSAS